MSEPSHAVRQRILDMCASAGIRVREHPDALALEFSDGHDALFVALDREPPDPARVLEDFHRLDRGRRRALNALRHLCVRAGFFVNTSAADTWEILAPGVFHDSTIPVGPALTREIRDGGPREGLDGLCRPLLITWSTGLASRTFFESCLAEFAENRGPEEIRAREAKTVEASAPLLERIKAGGIETYEELLEKFLAMEGPPEEEPDFEEGLRLHETWEAEDDERSIDLEDLLDLGHPDDDLVPGLDDLPDEFESVKLPTLDEERIRKADARTRRVLEDYRKRMEGGEGPFQIDPHAYDPDRDTWQDRDWIIRTAEARFWDGDERTLHLLETLFVVGDRRAKEELVRHVDEWWQDGRYDTIEGFESVLPHLYPDHEAARQVVLDPDEPEEHAVALRLGHLPSRRYFERQFKKLLAQVEGDPGGKGDHALRQLCFLLVHLETADLELFLLPEDRQRLRKAARELRHLVPEGIGEIEDVALPLAGLVAVGDRRALIELIEDPAWQAALLYVLPGSAVFGAGVPPKDTSDSEPPYGGFAWDSTFWRTSFYLLSAALPDHPTVGRLAAEALERCWACRVKFDDALAPAVAWHRHREAGS